MRSEPVFKREFILDMLSIFLGVVWRWVVVLLSYLKITVKMCLYEGCPKISETEHIT